MKRIRVLQIDRRYTTGTRQHLDAVLPPAKTVSTAITFAIDIEIAVCQFAIAVEVVNFIARIDVLLQQLQFGFEVRRHRRERRKHPDFHDLATKRLRSLRSFRNRLLAGRLRTGSGN